MEQTNDKKGSGQMDDLDRLLTKLSLADSHSERMVIEDQIRFLFTEQVSSVDQSKPNLEYIPVIENVDQQVITGIRAIIREEIHKLAFE
jgi:hypothetical protein